MRKAYKILIRKSEGKRPLGRQGTNGKIILQWILEKQDEKLWTAFIWFRTETSGGGLL
jgi:hypothetical protein